MYGDVKTSGYNVRGRIAWGRNVRGRKVRGCIILVAFQEVLRITSLGGFFFKIAILKSA